MPHARRSWQRPVADEDSPTHAIVRGFDPHSTGKVQKPAALLGPGQIVGERYCIHEEIAVGGMGRVYAAEHVALSRRVALKVLDPDLTRKYPDFHRRFLLEAATGAAIKHPNVVTVYDYGRVHESSDAYFMAMEMVEGESLHRTLRREGRLDWPRATRLAYETARALRAAHQAGAIHRDLKPSNIMVVSTDEGESVKVLDFGLVMVLDPQADATVRDSHMMGSPAYMAPEQILMKPVDPRTDIYALGVILHVLLSGRPPFKGETAESTLRAHLEAPVPRLPSYVPGPLAEIVMRCLQKEPDARWPDANSLVTALAQMHARAFQAQPLMPTLAPPAPRRSIPSGPRPVSDFPRIRSTTVPPPPRASGRPTGPLPLPLPGPGQAVPRTLPPIPAPRRPMLTGPLPRVDLQQLPWPGEQAPTFVSQVPPPCSVVPPREASPSEGPPAATPARVWWATRSPTLWLAALTLVGVAGWLSGLLH